MEYQLSDYREKARHGDSLLPVSYYCCHVPETYRNLTLHWHEEAEITYIEEGNVTYTINFESFSAQKGDLIFISPQILHGAVEKPGYTMTSHSLVFQLNYLGGLTPDICTVKYLNPILSGKHRFTPVVHPGDSGYTEMKELFLGACHVFRQEKPTYELHTKALLISLLSELYTNGYIVKTDRAHSDLHAEEKIKEILTYIQENYRESLSIQDLAAVCHFSETYFMHFFRKCTGTTCIEYLNRYRLSKAAAALEETDLPIMDIALENGFRNISYFNKLFKKRFESTPGEYREHAKAAFQARE
ncbi:MAG: AraC family transcriptional regulator [Lachnospiraceae bacterium]|nr:AraC family transcriptional regulator [Lachnospiraceae bacterium]